METRDPPSLAVKILAPIFFGFGAASALFWFASRSRHLATQLNEPVIAFDKGSFYLLGIGLALAILCLVVTQEYWFGKGLSKRLNRILTKLTILSLAIMLLTPHAVHLGLARKLESRSYTLCEDASHRWLFAVTLVYASPTASCPQESN